MLLLITLLARCVATGAAAQESFISPGSLASQGSLASRGSLVFPRAGNTTSSTDTTGSNLTSPQRRLFEPHPKKPLVWLVPAKLRSARTAIALLTLCAAVSVLGLMWQPGGAGNNARLPPRWEPGSNTSFRSWTQDLMIWAISSDLEVHQQVALVVSQLGGAAREIARTLSPAEIFQGGMVGGQHLDPLAYLLHGLSTRFGPLDDEIRLRSAQDLLNFCRRSGETTDMVLSRFEIVRSRARADGGGATVSIETASLILLRAIGVNHQQFQQLTQPLGFRLPSNEVEYLQLTHSIRRLGHIVESHRDNIASTLRSGGGSNHYWAGDAENTAEPAEDSGQQSHEPAAEGEWAYAADEDSATASATSSDNGSALDNTDLAGLSSAQVDEYLFGRYQHAKKRWRRFTGKPVRALRRVFRKKGKGKGSKGGIGSFGYLNLNEVLQNSYYKGKGKGGRSSGKGFGRRQNPRGRDGEIMKCSICQSTKHLRARCPQRPGGDGQGNTGGGNGSGVGQIHHTSQQGNRSMYVHFAAFDRNNAGSEQSWSQVNTPREEGQQPVPPGETTSRAEPDARERTPEVHRMTPTEEQAQGDPWQGTDPWVGTDPWQQWLDGQPRTSMDVRPTVPAWYVPDTRSFHEVAGVSRTPAAMGPSAGTGFNLPPLPHGYVDATQRLQSMVLDSAPAALSIAPITSVASETVSLFGQVQACRRDRARRHREGELQREEQPPTEQKPTLSRLPQEQLHPRGATRTHVLSASRSSQEETIAAGWSAGMCFTACVWVNTCNTPKSRKKVNWRSTVPIAGIRRA